MLDATKKHIEWKRSQRKPNPQKNQKGMIDKLKDPNNPIYKTYWIRDMMYSSYSKKYINKCIRVASKITGGKIKSTQI
tara:strand:+ start:85 stop:318 length:234 start_codon:yes stop_codon:yes gene_type:complete